MKKIKFDSKEYWGELEKALIEGKVKRIDNFEQVKKVLVATARRQVAQRERTKLVSLRVRENDLARLRERAADEGLPYQTVINSLIHKYAEGRV